MTMRSADPGRPRLQQPAGKPIGNGMSIAELQLLGEL
jgi:hypothetical protein